MRCTSSARSLDVCDFFFIGKAHKNRDHPSTAARTYSTPPMPVGTTGPATSACREAPGLSTRESSLMQALIALDIGTSMTTLTFHAVTMCTHRWQALAVQVAWQCSSTSFMRFEGMHWSPLIDTCIRPVAKNTLSLRLDKNHNMPCCSLGRRVHC